MLTSFCQKNNIVCEKNVVFRNLSFGKNIWEEVRHISLSTKIENRKQNNSPVLTEMFLQVKMWQNKYLFVFILLLLLFLSLLLLRRQRKATMGRSRRRGRPHAKSSSCKEGDPSRRRRDSVTSFYGRSLMLCRRRPMTRWRLGDVICEHSQEEETWWKQSDVIYGWPMRFLLS